MQQSRTKIIIFIYTFFYVRECSNRREQKCKKQIIKHLQIFELEEGIVDINLMLVEIAVGDKSVNGNIRVILEPFINLMFDPFFNCIVTDMLWGKVDFDMCGQEVIDNCGHMCRGKSASICVSRHNLKIVFGFFTSVIAVVNGILFNIINLYFKETSNDHLIYSQDFVIVKKVFGWVGPRFFIDGPKNGFLNGDDRFNMGVIGEPPGR